MPDSGVKVMGEAAEAEKAITKLQTPVTRNIDSCRNCFISCSLKVPEQVRNQSCPEVALNQWCLERPARHPLVRTGPPRCPMPGLPKYCILPAVGFPAFESTAQTPAAAAPAVLPRGGTASVPKAVPVW